MFDAYLFVDWSGAAVPGPPRPAKDNVWVGELAGRAEQTYHRTRDDGAAHVRERLLAHVGARRRVLVGFDFPYGYPAGLARALGLGAPGWRALWDLLAALIEDAPSNANNRFAVAAELNRRVHGAPGPFWGHPAGVALAHLTPTKPPPAGLPGRRRTEQVMRGTQETWKLMGNGAVGSQGLLGIPRVRALRDDPALAAVSRVWPFETGFTNAPLPPGALVLHAEIWPRVAGRLGDGIRDQAQVRAMCDWAAREDREGTLASWFAPPGLGAAASEAAVAEEGWILGCPASPG